MSVRGDHLTAIKTMLAATPSIGQCVWAGEQVTTLPAFVVFREGRKEREPAVGNFTPMRYAINVWLLVEPQPTVPDATATTVTWDDTVDARFRGNIQCCGGNTALWLDSIEVTRRTYLGHAYSCLVCRATLTDLAVVTNAPTTP